MEKRTVRRVANFQKIFCFVSFVFILVCCLWYGGRFIYFYLESNKSTKTSVSSLSMDVLANNSKSDNFKKINDNYYFVGNVSNNYVRYSNILWRIFKIDKDNRIYLISDDIMTTIAYGEDVSYSDSYVSKWLNKDKNDNSGILESNINNVSNYLDKYKVCIDKIDDNSNVKCNKEYSDSYIGLLSILDYMNTGGSDSFINNGYDSYLSNSTSDNEVWYITNNGKIDKSDGTDIFGVKPVISLKNNIKFANGDGSLDNPYVIDNDKSLFGGYVNLGGDIWRIYDVDGDVVKLMLNDTLKVNDEKLSYIYSNDSYYHNDTVYGSLAYYLNHTYLNSLTYKDKIISNNYSNGYYDSNYNYGDILKSTIDTKVSVISIGNVMLYNKNDSVWTNTGTVKNKSMVYVIADDGSLSSKSVSSKGYVIPCISINKDILTKGNGTKNSPYEME